MDVYRDGEKELVEDIIDPIPVAEGIDHVE